jgi:hypothetical protein
MKRTLVIVAAGLSLAACQPAEPGATPGPSLTSAPVSTPSPAAPTSHQPTPKGPTLPPPAQDSITVSGTVRFVDLEGGCWALDTAAKRYQLVGAAKDVLKDGARVTVVGVPRPDMATTCQIGEPLQVLSARPA